LRKIKLGKPIKSGSLLECTPEVDHLPTVEAKPKIGIAQTQVMGKAYAAVLQELCRFDPMLLGILQVGAAAAACNP
jgi:hypothetical protein